MASYAAPTANGRRARQKLSSAFCAPARPPCIHPAARDDGIGGPRGGAAQRLDVEIRFIEKPLEDAPGERP